MMRQPERDLISVTLVADTFHFLTPADGSESDGQTRTTFIAALPQEF